MCQRTAINCTLSVFLMWFFSLFAQKGKTFFRCKLQYFNFQSKAMVTLLNYFFFFTTFHCTKLWAVFSVFIRLQPVSVPGRLKWGRRLSTYMLLSMRLIGNALSFFNYANCCSCLNYSCIPESLRDQLFDDYLCPPQLAFRDRGGACLRLVLKGECRGGGESGLEQDKNSWCHPGTWQ